MANIYKVCMVDAMSRCQLIGTSRHSPRDWVPTGMKPHAAAASHSDQGADSATQMGSPSDTMTYMPCHSYRPAADNFISLTEAARAGRSSPEMLSIGELADRG